MNNSSDLFHNKLGAALTALASTNRFLVGLSGGLDSVVLLHALVRLRERPRSDIRLRAFHVNHQLQQEAGHWEQHCLRLCSELGVEFTSTSVEILGSSDIENAARQARYREFTANLREGEQLLLAHHRDDQMETLLLRFMRGSGPTGLRGIPQSRALGNNRLLRPLLDFDREALLNYATAEGLVWIEDPSNENESHDRNYCRHRILPLLKERWPGYRESWSKSAVLAKESAELIDDLAAIDMAKVVGDSRSVLNREGLLALSEPRRRNVLRHWLAGLGITDLGWNRLQRLSNEILQGSSAQFDGDDYQIICFRGYIYLLSSQALDFELADTELRSLPASAGAGEFPLPGNGRLRIRESAGGGIALDRLGNLSIRYRRGGETCRLLGRPSRPLKKILQELDVPPWLRSRIPLLFDGDELAYVPGAGVCEALAAKRGESGCSIEWEQPDLTPLR